ncbi:unnamed protein product [Ambrosiozyma monospora]|uniref:Unnamed protein product n=1 Tax=Ambrosiozyma monospora TaxID=43982 RepID=A0ACB5SW85_AMBMO|nr:unnamed protein product [Ambrosiozyma monospora]
MPSQIFKYEPISVRMRTQISYCKLCRSSEHRAVDCPEAKECLRCFRKGHHHLQCRTNLKFVDDPRKIERDADNALKSKKHQMTILQNVTKTKKAYNQRNEEALAQLSQELEKVRTPIVTPATPDDFTLVNPSKKRRRGPPSPARQQPTTSIQPLKEHNFNAFTLLPDEEEFYTPTPSPKAKANHNEAEKPEDEDHDMDTSTSPEDTHNKNAATSNTNESPIKIFNPAQDQLKKTDRRKLIPPTK